MVIIGKVIAIAVAMIASGLLGGWGGFLMGPPDPAALDDEKRKWALRRSLVLGVIAAAAIPLFLRFLGSVAGGNLDMMDQLFPPDGKISAWFVLIGFCLVAAVFSRRFLSQISEKLLDEALKSAADAKQKAEDAHTNLAIRFEEMQQDMAEIAKGGKKPNLSTEEQKFLQNILLPSTKTESHSFGLPLELIMKDKPKADVTNMIDGLKKKGLIRRSFDPLLKNEVIRPTVLSRTLIDPVITKDISNIIDK